jgi:hypothetical protein
VPYGGNSYNHKNFENKIKKSLWSPKNL